MSIERCFIHDRNWDSDFHEACPECPGGYGHRCPTGTAPQSGEAVPRRSAQDEPNYKALYTELKGEVLEKVGPFAEAAWLLVMEPGVSIAICEDDGTELVTDDDFRALSSLHEKLSSIGGSSSTESAASLADGKLTAGEAQQKSDWRTIDSAPRDGTLVDLWVYWPEHDTSSRTTDAHWNVADGEWQLGRYRPSQFVQPPTVTHWQPLPPPPNPSARGEL